MKFIFFITLTVVAALAAFGRLYPIPSYEEMFEKSDLVAIAQPLTTKDTGENGPLAQAPTSWKVIGLSTEFKTSLVLKGDKNLRQFKLHHYRLAATSEGTINGPHFVSFGKDETNAFLLFLVRESDGRYAPASGQNDPALFSILKLSGKAR